MPGPLIVVMVPARNAADDLPLYLESVERFADAVVALDDGSTDDTRAILEAHPLVRTVLTNPPRDGYAGWDQIGARTRLLEAAIDLGAQWVLSLDADELLAPDDGATLRAFVAPGGGADPDHAYLLRVYRMIEDLEHYDDDGLLVGRLFAPRRGHAYPTDRALHFVPVPTAIPRERWVPTTLRIQHRSSITAERRRRRFEKFRELDPDHEWQAIGYDHLLAGPGRVRRWEPRDPFLPVVPHTRVPDPAPLAPGEPVASVIVISQDDEAVIERAVGSVVAQELEEPFEVIVVHSGTDRTDAIVRERFPSVTTIQLDRPVLPGGARNAGLAVARGRYVAMVGSHQELAPGYVAAMVAAHRDGWPMVMGSMVNGTRTWAGWASYFIDHTAALPSRPSYTFEGPPPRCSYRRAVLDVVGPFPDDLRAGEDTVVNQALWRRGYGAYRERDVVATHHSPCATPPGLLRHHYLRGRGLGRILADDVAAGRLRRRAAVRRVARVVPSTLGVIHGRMRRWGDGLHSRYRWALPLVVAGVVAHAVGATRELTARLVVAPGLGRGR